MGAENDLTFLLKQHGQVSWASEGSCAKRKQQARAPEVEAVGCRVGVCVCKRGLCV